MWLHICHLFNQGVLDDLTPDMTGIIGIQQACAVTYRTRGEISG